MERIDDSFAQLRDEMREFRVEMRTMRSDFGADLRTLRTELFQLKLFMLGGHVTILAAVVALHG
jgi:hypothetical protein